MIPVPQPPPVAFDPHAARRDFPLLGRQVHGKPLVYLDNAATTQKPQAVLDALRRYYLEECSNIHRGVHELSVLATRDYESARGSVRRFLHAAEDREIVFVRGATEGINLVMASWGRRHVGAGDEVVITAMEHHANLVPWQVLCEETGARLRVAPINDEGELLLGEMERLIGARTRIVAVTHVSNALGTINPVREIAEMAHRAGAIVVVDGAQAAPHMPVDVRAMGCDFYALSGHKMYGPTGIGVLYGRAELLESMPPYQVGGDMIRSVRYEKSTWNDIPWKFEAGTPNIAGAIGLGAAVEYLERSDRAGMEAWERQLVAYASDRLRELPWVRLIGTAREKAAVVSFVTDSIHPHDLGTVLDREGVAIRTGHHCAQPLMERYGVVATARASFSFYNLREEVDALLAGLWRAREVLA